MITGFNTDIEYAGVTYHVQTEDKGLSKPMILSLVYNRGTILASKRASYEDLLGAEFDEKALSERLQKQHRLICAAVKAGRIEDLKKMTAQAAAAATAKKAAATTTAVIRPLVTYDNFNLATPEPAQEPAKQKAEPVKTEPPVENGAEPDELPIPKPFSDPGFGMPVAVEATMVEGISIIEDEVILPAEAVAIIEEPDLPNPRENDRLAIEILGDVTFRGGERSTVGFVVTRGSSRTVVTGAQIMVKVLGSNFRPVIFHASTDNTGIATVNLQLPNFVSGRAAFLVRARSDGEEIELRRAIEHS